jgi:hypothetical protein
MVLGLHPRINETLEMFPTLWVDLSYKTAFGCDGYAPIVRPSARRLNNKNPNIRDNFNNKRKQYADRCHLGDHIILLEQSIHGKMTKEQILEYKAIDRLRMLHTILAEAKCRKLRCRNISYSMVTATPTQTGFTN